MIKQGVNIIGTCTSGTLALAGAITKINFNFKNQYQFQKSILLTTNFHKLAQI